MITIANSFLFTILTLYTFYRRAISTDDIFVAMTDYNFMWQSLYLIYLFLIFYTGYLITSKVNSISSNAINIFLLQYAFYYLKG